MVEIKSLDTDSAIFRLRTAEADRTLANQARLQRDGYSDADLQRVSEQFESLLLNFMLREMRATVPESALFPQSMTEEIFSGMLDEQIAGEMAKNGGIGISRMLFNQLKGEK
jgi:flagellar protein FlgJ